MHKNNNKNNKNNNKNMNFNNRMKKSDRDENIKFINESSNDNELIEIVEFLKKKKNAKKLNGSHMNRLRLDSNSVKDNLPPVFILL